MNANKLRKKPAGFDQMTMRQRWRFGEFYQSYLQFLSNFGFIGKGIE